jgi:hypothetical protein
MCKVFPLRLGLIKFFGSSWWVRVYDPTQSWKLERQYREFDSGYWKFDIKYWKFDSDYGEFDYKRQYRQLNIEQIKFHVPSTTNAANTTHMENLTLSEHRLNLIILGFTVDWHRISNRYNSPGIILSYKYIITNYRITTTQLIQYLP